MHRFRSQILPSSFIRRDVKPGAKRAGEIANSYSVYGWYKWVTASAHLERRIPKAREHELHVLGCQQPGAMAEAQGLQQRSHVEIRIKNITILNGTGAQNPSQSEDRSTTTHYANSHSLHQWNQQKDG